MLLRLFKNELIVSLCLQNNVVLKNETMPQLSLLINKLDG